jgi:hypothetical protein
MDQTPVHLPIPRPKVAYRVVSIPTAIEVMDRMGLSPFASHSGSPLGRNDGAIDRGRVRRKNGNTGLDRSSQNVPST